MAGTRKTHSAAFKAQVAMAALKGDKTINELASQHGVHPTLIHAWKKQLVAGAEDIFSNGSKQAFGKTSSKCCLRNSRQRTRSTGIERSWIAPRCAHPAEEQKPAQIPRIGANWEASIICSPMPTASP